MGQELTARMFHTNLSKKELCYFAWKDILEADVFGCEMQDYANYIGAVLYYNGEECGKIVDATKDYVLALILSEIHLNGIKGGVIEGVHKEIIHFNDKKFSLKQDNGPLEFTICKITIRKY
jgi:folate-binding Fe-S cluster repair protein YgfZ